jgi:hypothetical protein
MTPLHERVNLTRVDLRSLRAETSLRGDRLPPKAPRLALDFEARGDIEDDAAIAVITYEVVGVDSETSVECLRIHAEYHLTYVVSGDPPTTADVQDLANQSGVFNSWGFFRELVASTYARMNIPLPLIPTLPPGLAISSPWRKTKPRD